MATLETVYTGDLRTEITHLQSGNKITTDAPTDNNGKGEYISPTDMLAGALGSCMLTIMGMSARNQGFSIDGTRLEISKIMGTDPRRIVEIKIDIHFPEGSNYTDSQKRVLMGAVRSCPAEHSLHPDIKRTIQYIW